jgi:hypothetical protein
MKAAFGLLAGLVLAALATHAPACAPRVPDAPARVKAGEYTLSGPYTHGNLTVFLIHGKETLPGKKFMTLQEALDQKKIVAYETQNVNRLEVENTSPDTEIFIQSGDIVKGGQQDRVLAYDLILPAKSGKVAIEVFCVEPGRWQQRGHEAVGRFASSANQVQGKALKLAVNSTRDQREVWMRVREAQMKLSHNVGKPLANSASPSSLQLTLEDKELLQAVDQYVKALAHVPDKEKDVIGCAVAINGQMDGADVYCSGALFRKLWPKLLGASATDALAELNPKNKFKPVTAEAVKTFLADAAKAKKQEKDLTKRIQVITRDSEKKFVIETRYNRAGQGAAAPAPVAVHQSHVSK